MTIIMNEYDKSWCAKILNDLINSKPFEMFIDPVDPIQDGAPDYFDVIKHPMDFTTIKKKIESNAYIVVSEFINDVKLIAQNSINYNGEGSLYGGAALMLLKEIDEALNDKAGCANDEWYRDLRKVLRTLDDHIVIAPPSISRSGKTNPKTA